MARIYIETTVVSFYFNARSEPEMVARQNWTRRWLDAALLSSDELVTSVAVETELSAGDFPNKSDMIKLASRFPLLASMTPSSKPSRRTSRITSCQTTPVVMRSISQPLHSIAATSWSHGIAATLRTQTNLDTFVA